VWTWWERSLSNAAHFGFLVPWVAAAALAAWMRWRPGLHLAAVSLVSWLIPLGFFILGHHAHWLVALLGAALAAAVVAAGPAIDQRARVSAATFAYAIVIAYAALFIMQFVDSRWFFGTAPNGSLGRLILLAAISIVGLLGAMLWALKTDNTAALWLAYAGFAVEVFMLHVMTIGTLLNTSLFFLISALIVSAFAYAAYRLHQRKAATPGVAS